MKTVLSIALCALLVFTGCATTQSQPRYTKPNQTPTYTAPAKTPEILAREEATRIRKSQPIGTAMDNVGTTMVGAMSEGRNVKIFLTFEMMNVINMMGNDMGIDPSILQSMRYENPDEFKILMQIMGDELQNMKGPQIGKHLCANSHFRSKMNQGVIYTYNYKTPDGILLFEQSYTNRDC